MVEWFFILIAQSMAFTWVSRARNSSSIAYNAVASILSNAVFFVAQLFLIGYMAKANMPLPELLKLGAVYTSGMTVGGVLMHWVALNYLETGKRKVGA